MTKQVTFGKVSTLNGTLLSYFCFNDNQSHIYYSVIKGQKAVTPKFQDFVTKAGYRKCIQFLKTI